MINFHTPDGDVNGIDVFKKLQKFGEESGFCENFKSIKYGYNRIDISGNRDNDNRNLLWELNQTYAEDLLLKCPGYSIPLPFVSEGVVCFDKPFTQDYLKFNVINDNGDTVDLSIVVYSYYKKSELGRLFTSRYMAVAYGFPKYIKVDQTEAALNLQVIPLTDWVLCRSKFKEQFDDVELTYLDEYDMSHEKYMKNASVMFNNLCHLFIALNTLNDLKSKCNYLLPDDDPLKSHVRNRNVRDYDIKLINDEEYKVHHIYPSIDVREKMYKKREAVSYNKDGSVKRTFTRRCGKWLCRGTTRHLANGTEIQIKPFYKGPERNNENYPCKKHNYIVH